MSRGRPDANLDSGADTEAVSYIFDNLSYFFETPTSLTIFWTWRSRLESWSRTGCVRRRLIRNAASERRQSLPRSAWGKRAELCAARLCGPRRLRGSKETLSRRQAVRSTACGILGKIGADCSCVLGVSNEAMCGALFCLDIVVVC
jgi:hypothetical protein